MSVLIGILSILHLLSCVLLIIVVLLQSGRGHGVAGLFGGGANRAVPASLLEEGELARAQNILYPKESAFPKTRPGLVKIQTGTASSTGMRSRMAPTREMPMISHRASPSYHTWK